MSNIKRKEIECPIHGLTIFRCKRKCWQSKQKDKTYRSDYTEKCDKCTLEGRYKPKIVTEEKKKKFISLK